ncbi:MAG TPA: hypothetical protein VMU07_01295 [Candidatus Paceibacterota bacterium]|nr:hypothetical protein [Candidatus Paceibacterota bacterium]
MSLPNAVAKPTRFVLIVLATTPAVLIRISVLFPHWPIFIFAVVVGMVLPLILWHEEIRKQIQKAFASIYFRYRFGIWPCDKKNWIAMKVIQQVVDRVLGNMQAAKKSLKREIAQLTEDTVAAKQSGSIVLGDPIPSEARKMIQAYERKLSETRSFLNEKTEELTVLEANIGNATLIAKLFSFNV